jgi:hypothetical protein
MNRFKRDDSQSPTQPIFKLSPSSTEADIHRQLADSSIEGPGAIANRLQNQQWSISRAQNQIPRAEPDAEMDRDHSTPYG